MGFNIAKDYVDRDEERARFHAMRSGKTDERILVILVPGEKGKSCLLSRLRYECEKEAPSTPLVLLDFDRRRSTLSDEFSVAQEIRRCCGDACVSRVCECLDEMTRPVAPIHIQTGAGTGSVDFGRHGRFNEAEVSDIAGRDNISVSVNAAAGFALTPEQREAQKERLGRALRDDLLELGEAHARAVILIDTFEQISTEMRAWLERWLFEPLCQAHNVMLVIAGRPQHPDFPLRSYFEQPHRWSYLIETVERFPPFAHAEVQIFFHRQGVPIALEEYHLLAAACENPALMRLLADQLRQQYQGGAR